MDHSYLNCLGCSEAQASTAITTTYQPGARPRWLCALHARPIAILAPKTQNAAMLHISPKLHESIAQMQGAAIDR